MQGNKSFGSLLEQLASIVKPMINNYRSANEYFPFWEDVKVIHADDLRAWGCLKEYSEHDSISYAEYQNGVKRLDTLKGQVREALKAQARLEELEMATLEEYDTVNIHVPRSLFRSVLEIPLPEPPHEKTKMTCYIGEIRNRNLYVKGKWKEQIAIVHRSCPADILHKEELETLRQKLKDLLQQDLEILNEIKTSRFAHPVLFISHRWESTSHPDPEGHQYRKLCKLRDCFIIYDYCSFPQRINNEGERAALLRILTNMNRLIKNVLVIESSSYMERGWCIYEYLLASLKLSTVCDEIGDPDFVRLRNFRATRPTIPDNIFKGHSIDSSIQNGIAAEIIQTTVNQILPKFNNSLFTVEDDREIVTELLLEHLLKTLPAKKEYPSPYLGEWVSVPWTREELQNAFENGVELGELYIPQKLHPYKLKVPATIEEAIANNYTLDEAPPNTSMTWLERMWG